MYNAGIAAADARVNTSSASYNSGYTNGKSAASVRVVCSGHIDEDGGACDFFCQVYKNGNSVYGVYYHSIGAKWSDDKTF